MDNNLKNKIQIALTHQKENKALVKKLKKSKPKSLDGAVHQIHDKTFNEIDCITCANCCKTTSPAIYERDVDRLAKYLRIKPTKFIEQYLQIDEDDDYVFKTSPCPFLGSDNYCSVYDSRPLACREYPHTNRKRFYQVLTLSLRNTKICPAVATVFEELRKNYS